MKKTILLIILLISIISGMFWFLEKEKPEPEVVITIFEDTDEVLKNPGKGLFFQDYPEEENGEDFYSHISVGYKRFNWSEIEPEEGIYNWKRIDDYIELYQSMGMKFAFGIMNVNSAEKEEYITPKWVFDAGAEGVPVELYRTWTGTREDFIQRIPIWRDPVFLEKQKEFIKTLARRYDGDPRIAYIDIRSYGMWGEQHLYGLEEAGEEDLTAEELRELYLKPYADNFNKTLLAAPYGKKEYIPAYEWGAEHGITIRRDGIMDYSDGSECLISYGKYPSVFEYAASFVQRGMSEEDESLLESYIENGKPSYLQIYPDMYYEHTEFFKRMANKIGYYFRLKQVQYPAAADADSEMEIKLSVKNDGVAPLYEPAVLYIGFLDGSGYPVARYETSMDPKKWKPQTVTEETIRIRPKGLKNGEYQVAIGLFSDNLSKKPAYRFGSTGGTEDNWWICGTITVR